MYGEAGLLRTESANRGGAAHAQRSDSGLAFSEGAVTVVLEDRTFARDRGARVLARMSGYRHANEGKNPFKVDPTGQSQARLLHRLLDSAGAQPADVGFVVGHGNELSDCDQSERNYMQRVFGELTGGVPLISTKPVFGHVLGGAGSVNLAAAALMAISSTSIWLPISASIPGTYSDEPMLCRCPAGAVRLTDHRHPVIYHSSAGRWAIPIDNHHRNNP